MDLYVLLVICGVVLNLSKRTTGVDECTCICKSEKQTCHERGTLDNNAHTCKCPLLSNSPCLTSGVTSCKCNEILCYVVNQLEPTCKYKVCGTEAKKHMCWTLNDVSCRNANATVVKQNQTCKWISCSTMTETNEDICGLFRDVCNAHCTGTATPLPTNSTAHVRTLPSEVPTTTGHISQSTTPHITLYSASNEATSTPDTTAPTQSVKVDKYTASDDDTSTLDNTTPTLSVKADEVKGDANEFPVAAAVVIPLLVLGVVIVVVVVVMFRIRKSPKRADYQKKTINSSGLHISTNIHPSSSSTTNCSVVGNISNRMYGIDASNDADTANLNSAGNNQTENNDASYARIDECIDNVKQNDDATESTYSKIDECSPSSDQKSNDNNDVINERLFKQNGSTCTEYSALCRRNENGQEYETLSAQELNTPTEKAGVEMKRYSVENQSVNEPDREDDETGQYFILEKQSSDVRQNSKDDHANFSKNSHNDEEQLGTYFILEKENVATSANHEQQNESSNSPVFAEETHGGACPDYLVLENTDLLEGSASTMPQNDSSNMAFSNGEDANVKHVPDYFVLENVELREEIITDKPQSGTSHPDITSRYIEDEDATIKTGPDYFVLEAEPLKAGITTGMPQSDTQNSDINGGNIADGDDKTISPVPEYFVLEAVTKHA